MHSALPSVVRRLTTSLTCALALLSATTATIADTEPSTLRFAPLPLEGRKVLLAQFRPMLAFLERSTGETFSILPLNDYESILSGLREDRIDLAFLGPLPYILLTEEGPQFEPLVRFLNAEGESEYRCALARFGKQPARLQAIGGAASP